VLSLFAMILKAFVKPMRERLFLDMV
jgi:hypothetical protein